MQVPHFIICSGTTVNAEASTASPSTREEGPHNDAQHDAPEALQPVGPDEDTIHTLSPLRSDTGSAITSSNVTWRHKDKVGLMLQRVLLGLDVAKLARVSTVQLDLWRNCRKFSWPEPSWLDTASSTGRAE
ncbi:hypothetical protein EYF80_005392 [Liparis tanakae]|uniref:Uncharacterized protein n=1 Tax=Liparis tanakae TaxID=230148 RepID=A0A4Z2J2F9_9TELE|nr:hypothetical protein EYF80_005392 [Liparis tanakae]